MNLICTYNLNSKEDAQNLRMQYIEEVTPIKAEREKLRQLYKKATNESDKTIIRAKIETITEDINKINSKIQAFSVETSGVLDLDSELELYFSGLGKVKFEFTSGSDIVTLGKLISEKIL